MPEDQKPKLNPKCENDIEIDIHTFAHIHTHAWSSIHHQNKHSAYSFTFTSHSCAGRNGSHIQMLKEAHPPHSYVYMQSSALAANKGFPTFRSCSGLCEIKSVFVLERDFGGPTGCAIGAFQVHFQNTYIQFVSTFLRESPGPLQFVCLWTKASHQKRNPQTCSE